MPRFVTVPVVAALVAAGAAVVTAPPAAAATVTTPGGYVAVSPKRIVDTRSGLNVARAGRIAAGQTLPAAILGHGGLPGSGVSAVQVTITVLSPTSSGGITAFGAGSAPPTTNLQFSAGQAVSDEAIVPVSAGSIQLKDTQTAGTADVVVDLQGYYRSGTATRTGAFHPLPSAIRAIDTRTGTGVAAKAPLGAGSAVLATPRGAGLPTTGVGAVAVTITAVGPTRPGSIVAWPYGSGRPLPASLYFAADKGGSAFAVVGLVAGHLDLYNSATAPVNVVVDVVGYYAAGVPLAAGAFGPLGASRVSAAGIASGQIRAVRVTGGGVPRPAGTVALVSITVVAPSRSGGITAWQSAVVRPGTTTMQFAGGQEIIGTAAVPISASGYINLYNASSGSATIVVDVHGYVAPTTITPPAVQKGRYPNDLAATPDVSGNPAKMSAHGCADAQAGSRFVLLDIGAQSISAPTLSATNRGVVLTPVQTRTPLSYADLRNAVQAYLNGYAGCAPTTAATVAIGTSNDGAFDPSDAATYYAPTSRGADWAANVNLLRTWAATNTAHLSVVGAIDIEAAFSSTETQAQQWETAFLGHTSATLIYNGDANSCPATFGVHGATCAFGWTQAQYYALAHHGSRIQVLPQIYFPAEAVKWADIDATGGGGLIFAGALTESVDPGTNSPGDGWAYLVRAISSVTGAPSIPRSVDIAPDS